MQDSGPLNEPNNKYWERDHETDYRREMVSPTNPNSNIRNEDITAQAMRIAGVTAEDYFTQTSVVPLEMKTLPQTLFDNFKKGKITISLILHVINQIIMVFMKQIYRINKFNII